MRLIYVTIKTTGLSAEDAAIIQIQAIVVEQGQELGRFLGEIHPESYRSTKTIHSHALKIAGVTMEQMLDFSPLPEVLHNFKHFLLGHTDGIKYIMVSHNAEFNMAFLEEAGKDCNIDLVDRFFDKRVASIQDLALHLILHGALEEGKVSRGELLAKMGIDQTHGDFKEAEMLRELYQALGKLVYASNDV